MKTFKTVPTITEELVKIKCDNCGKESNHNKDTSAGPAPYIDTIHIHWGYGSDYDDELWEIDLCQSCLVKMFGNIKHIYKNEIAKGINE